MNNSSKQLPNRTHPPIEDTNLLLCTNEITPYLVLAPSLQTEDIIDDLIQYQSGSYKLDSSFGSDFQIKQEPLHLTDQEKKERVKKDNHNQSKCFRVVGGRWNLSEIHGNAFQFDLINGRSPVVE